MVTYSTTVILPKRPLSPEEQNRQLDLLLAASSDRSAPAEQLVHDAAAIRAEIQSDPRIKREIRTALDGLSGEDSATLFFD